VVVLVQGASELDRGGWEAARVGVGEIVMANRRWRLGVSR
jgi:hypothetical protein